jgi:hypothetical protein
MILAIVLFMTLPATAETVPFRNPIVAQESATCANVFLAVQLSDALTTRAILEKGGYERDPLARPFVRTTAGAIASAVVINVAARYILHRHPSLMCYSALADSIAVANNIRVLGRMR